jgi:hypothetical protein
MLFRELVLGPYFYNLLFRVVRTFSNGFQIEQSDLERVNQICLTLSLVR